MHIMFLAMFSEFSCYTHREVCTFCFVNSINSMLLFALSLLTILHSARSHRIVPELLYIYSGFCFVYFCIAGLCVLAWLGDRFSFCILNFIVAIRTRSPPRSTIVHCCKQNATLPPNRNKNKINISNPWIW